MALYPEALISALPNSNSASVSSAYSRGTGSHRSKTEINLEQKTQAHRLLNSAEGENQRKVLFRKETAQDLTQVHLTQPNRQRIQKEHINERQNDALK